MSAEFKAPQINAKGCTAPILLVGALGESKESKFVSLLNIDVAGKSPTVVTIDLFDVSTSEESHSNQELPFVGEVFSKVDAAKKDGSPVVVVFLAADECEPSVLSDILRKISEREFDKVTYVIGCADIPGSIRASEDIKNSLQIVEFYLPPKPPVLQVDELEESPFHEYAFKASFLTKYPNQINDPKDNYMLDELSELMSAVEGIEGGILGQEAHDRGMDGSVINALAGFSRAFKGSQNTLADSIAKAVIKELQSCPVVAKFTEVSPQQMRHQHETPTIGR